MQAVVQITPEQVDKRWPKAGWWVAVEKHGDLVTAGPFGSRAEACELIGGEPQPEFVPYRLRRRGGN
jgi:hypothetical protein